MGAKQKQGVSPLNQSQEKINTRALAASEHKSLCLKAANADDLDIMAVLMQDAIIPAPNFYYDLDQRTFTIKANRFCWETPCDRLNHQKVYQRVLTCLQFQNISHVQHINFKKGDANAYYNLLTITTSNSHNKGEILAAQMVKKASKKTVYTIDLIFSHDTRIRLHATEVKALLLDSDETSYTNRKPAHTRQDVGKYILANAIREHINQNKP